MARHAAKSKSHAKRVVVWGVLAVAIAIAVAAYAVIVWGVAQSDADSNGAAASVSASSSAAAGAGAGATELGKQSVPAPDSQKEQEQIAAQQSATANASAQARMNALAQQLKSQIAGYSGAYAVAVIDLSVPGQPSFELNNQRLPAASLIKLAVLNAVYAQEANGKLAASANTDALLKQMITVSSNEATNSLISELGNGDFAQGEALVNSISDQSGLSGFKLNRRLGITGYSGANDNYTTPVDCAKELQMIYNGQLVSASASQHMMALLRAQTRRSKIPAGVPSGIPVANKTGENTGLEHDAAVVYGSKSGGDDYALVVMTQSASNAVPHISALSSTVYRALGTASTSMSTSTSASAGSH